MSGMFFETQCSDLFMHKRNVFACCRILGRQGPIKRSVFGPFALERLILTTVYHQNH